MMMNSSTFLPVERFLRILNWWHTQLGLNVPPIVATDYLRALPPDSFGYAWAKHLDECNLEPFTTGPRRQQLHDGVHVLTGYDTEPLGEAEVQSFLLGAKFHLMHILILGMLLLRIERLRCHPLIRLTRSEIRQRLIAAYHRGKDANFEPDTWQPERLWEMPFKDVQLLLGLKTS